MIEGFWASARRLLFLQASWTYERLQGIGLGYAILPLLAPLAPDTKRYTEAVARSVGYFNAHPYLAGVAAGATATAERAGQSGADIQRLKTALAGPLGALGDQFFWVGLVPAVIGGVLAGVALGGSVALIVVALVLYGAIRLGVAVWGLRTGLVHGLGVPAALKAFGLPDKVRLIGYAAGFAVGFALPLIAFWYADGGLEDARWAVLIGAVAGIVAAMAGRRLVSARLLTLLAMVVVFVWAWSRG